MDFLALANNAPTGALSGGEVDALQKALTAGYGTDMANLTGGAALRVQSLDTTMQAVIQQNEDFKLFNRLPKPKAGATVDEWTEQNSVGGFLGGTTNTETGAIADATGSYARRVGMVKYLMTKRQVSLVQTLQTAIADSEAVEYNNGALQLLTDANFLCYEGDSTVVATEFDGVYAQLVAGIAAGNVDGDHIIDARGDTLNNIALFNAAVATIRRPPNFGRPTDVFMSMDVQADLDTGLDPAFRVPLPDVPNGGIMIGAPVIGIRTSGGNIKTNDDGYVRDANLLTPFEQRYAAQAALQAGLQPTIAVDPSVTDAASLFAAAHAGNYYYLVTGLNANGESTGVISSQQAVAAGKKVTITITASGGGTETGYAIYRSRLGGGNVAVGGADGLSDFRFMARIPKTGSSTTYVDRNKDLPGSSKAYLLNLRPTDTAITWRQLLPMLRFNLYPTNSAIIPWAQLLFGYLRISKLRHHAVIKNIVTKNAIFKPFVTTPGG